MKKRERNIRSMGLIAKPCKFKEQIPENRPKGGESTGVSF